MVTRIDARGAAAAEPRHAALERERIDDERQEFRERFLEIRPRGLRKWHLWLLAQSEPIAAIARSMQRDESTIREHVEDVDEYRRLLGYG